MAKKKKPLIYLIYSDLVSAVNGIGKKTYLDRPKSVTEELANFIVVDIPTEIRGMVKGSVDFKADCYGTFSVFCKAKTDATINIGSQSELTQKVLDLFPINGKYITASRPRVLMQGEDGYGYQVTQITFSLHTKTNARNID